MVNDGEHCRCDRDGNKDDVDCNVWRQQINKKYVEENVFQNKGEFNLKKQHKTKGKMKYDLTEPNQMI